MTEQARLTDQSVTAFIDATAAKQPTPGGGSVAGVVGGLGTALGEMSLAFTRGKKAFAAHEADYEQIAGRLADARRRFIELVAEDMAAYGLYQEVSKYEGPDKAEKEQVALTAAINVPREMTSLALAVLGDLESLLGRCNKWLVTDLAAGAVLAEAVVKLSDYNVRINVGSCPDKQMAEQLQASSTADCEKARAIAEKIEASVKQSLSS